MSAGDLSAAEPAHRRWVGLILVLAIGAGLIAAVVALPRENSSLPAVAHQALGTAEPQWHTTEPVNEVVYGTRGFDTFGETFLLLAAVVSVVLLTRSREPRRGFVGEEQAGEREARTVAPKGEVEPAEKRQARVAEAREAATRRAQSTPDHEPLGRLGVETAETMSVVARTASRVTAPVLAIAGFYLCAWGYTPGGGFPAGAVMLGVILLVYAGFGYSKISRFIRQDVLELVEMAGALLIVGTEVLGLVFKGSVSSNWLPLAPIETIRAGGVLQLFSGGELVEVATGLTLVVFAILGMRHDWAADEPPGDS